METPTWVGKTQKVAVQLRWFLTVLAFWYLWERFGWVVAVIFLLVALQGELVSWAMHRFEARLNTVRAAVRELYYDGRKSPPEGL